MSDRILVCHAEGIGNCIQLSPCLRTLKEVLGYKLDYWHAFGSFKIPKIIPYVDKWFRGKDIKKIKPEQYVGLVSTAWTKKFLGKVPLKNLTKITPLSMFRSEVDTYMDIARYLGVPDDKLIWYGNCTYKKVEDTYDIVMHNGYNPKGTANWEIKSYPWYVEVAKMFKESKLSVCSVGAKSEYIFNTVDLTGINLMNSLGLIKNAKLFIGNDSGLYHCANALGVTNVVIFTATSIAKNYDSRFHKFSTIIGRDDLKCRPCQSGKHWKNCKTWECKNIHPQIIYKAVMGLLNRTNYT